MDLTYLLDAASLSLRMLHVVVAIAWIGSSFYFVWLDDSLHPPEDEGLRGKGVGGELWAMHGGGFYNPQKYTVAPPQLPERLHFFFWPSYTTFVSGFLLVTVLYYCQAGSYMLEPGKWISSAAGAVHLGVLSLAAGWLVYDGLCRWVLEAGAGGGVKMGAGGAGRMGAGGGQGGGQGGGAQVVFAVVYTLFIAAAAYGLCASLSGRAAYLHVGAMMATAMTANVFFVIIPAQRKTVAAMKAGLAPDPALGKKAKQRSVHNNYLTLPVLFAMISNHYAFTYNHSQAWAVLVAVCVALVLIRHFFNLRHKGSSRWEYPLVGGSILLAVALVLMPTPPPVNARVVDASTIAERPVMISRVMPVIATRCTPCHSAAPSLLPAAPAGVLLDTPEQLRLHAPRVFMQAVRLQAMPQANKTGMTLEERALIAAWMADGAK